MADKVEDQTKFSEHLSKPTELNEQKVNRILKFEENGSINFNEAIKSKPTVNAWTINDRNVLGFRGSYDNNDNVGDLSGSGSRNGTVMGDATLTENFVYNGGVNDPKNPEKNNVPNYFNKDDPQYKDSDYAARVNATYIVEGMAVNQLRS